MTSQLKTIVKLMDNEKYEEGLGVGYNADNKEIYDAYSKLIISFKDQTEVETALNLAFSALMEEKDADKGRRLF